MKYRLNTTNYHDFATFAVNKLPARSYFIPYPGRAAADAVAPKQKRYASPKVQCLNGEWDFKFYPRPDELPVELDTDAVHFDKLDVPSCWQFRGYDKPFYVNIRYQFPYKPPVIPTTGKVSRAFSWLGCDTGIRPQWKVPGEEYNFVGVYRRFIEIDDADKRRIVSFLGVASCMDLYVNGFFIGYSEGAHNTAEFDLTGKLKSGHNELVVVVHRWCNGTYLEDQDMFRNNGIFRDVLLRTEEPTDLWDIDAKTEKKPDGYTLTLSAQTLSDIDVAFTVKGHGLEQTATVTARNGTAQAVFAGLDVTEWNAEVPTLYNIYYETATSCVKEKIGFRTVEIKQDVFLLNGRKIKLKGVNHHDTDAANGYTMSPDDIERDMLVCKRFNIDTVRTSHYPPDPLLLELADELGIYIVDENDLETHGTFAMQLPPTYNSISNDPKWESHYMDRIMRLYQRDKIRGNTSVIMWSLGNEAGGYHNTDHVEQNIQVFIRHAGCGKNIAGAVIAGKSVCRSASFGIQVERIALLGFKHFVFQKVRGTGGQLDPFAVKGKFPHNGAKVGGVHGVYRAVARHSAAQNRQAAGQGHALAVDRPRGFFPDGSRAVFCVFHHAFSPSPFAVSV